jgi:hypothetical protein
MGIIVWPPEKKPMSEESTRGDWTDGVGCVCIAACFIAVVVAMYSCDRNEARLRQERWLIEHQQTNNVPGNTSTDSLPESPR